MEHNTDNFEAKQTEIIALMADMDTGEELAIMAVEAMQSLEQQELMLEYLHEVDEAGETLTKNNLLTAIVVIHNRAPAQNN